MEERVEHGDQDGKCKLVISVHVKPTHCSSERSIKRRKLMLPVESAYKIVSNAGAMFRAMSKLRVSKLLAPL